MNKLKARLVASRIARCLENRREAQRIDVAREYHFDVVDDGDGIAEQAAFEDAVNHELDHLYLDSDRHNSGISYRNACRLSAALTQRLADLVDGELGPIDEAAFTYLALLLGCDMPIQTSAVVDISFGRSTITYEGDFEVFRRELQAGPSLSSDSRPYFTVRSAEVGELVFEQREADAGSFLRTCTVGGKLRLAVELTSDDQTLEDHLRQLNVSLGHPLMQTRRFAPTHITVLERKVA